MGKREIEEKQLLAQIFGNTQAPSVYSLAVLQKSRRFLHNSPLVSSVAQLSAYETFTIFLLLSNAKHGYAQAVLDGESLKAQMITEGYDSEVLTSLALLQGITLSQLDLSQ